MWASTGVWEGEEPHRFGLDDAEYAKAVSYLSEHRCRPLTMHGEPAEQARAEAESTVLSDMRLDLRILARELFGREGRNLDVAVQAIDRMTGALAELRGQLAAELADRGTAP